MDRSVKKLIVAAMMAALACVGTLVHIPAPAVGYVHAGDAVVVLAGALLGPLYGTVAAGLGSALADLLLGYVLYAPATFVIKALVALTVSLLADRVRTAGMRGYLMLVFCGLLGGFVTVGGYFVYEIFLYGLGAAIPGLLLNALQALVGAIAGALLITQLRRVRLLRELR